MKKINLEALEPGDIILTTSEAWESAVIRTVTGSDISHAMICVSTSSVMDSTGEGVHSRNPQKMFYPDACAIHILKLRESPAPDVIGRAIAYIRDATATSYDVGEAAQSVLPMRKPGSTRQFCSRLVARAYAHAGIQLVGNPDFCTPQDLKASPMLVAAGNAWIKASDEEVAAMQVEGDATIGMRAVTMAFIEGVRELDAEVESLNEAIKLAIARPDLDLQVSRRLLASGYLDYWKVEASKYAWRYDVTEMVRFQTAHEASGEPIADLLKEYCEETLASDANGDFQHWQESLHQFNTLCKQYDRETLRLFQDLYVTLVMQHAKRVATARTWLNWRKSIHRDA